MPPSYTLLLAALASCSFPAAEEVDLPVAAGPRNVAILLYDGVELLDFAGPGEVFSSAQDANGRAFRVFTVAKSKARLSSQGFVDITPEFALADCPQPDIVVVPGGHVPDQDLELQQWVRTCAESSELLVSVCNGAFLLAEAGLLDGLEVTSHHGALSDLHDNYPKVRVLTNRRFVDSGRILTCAGVSAGIDGALHVVERLLGNEAARHTARYMEYDWRPEVIAAQQAEPGRTPEESVGRRLAECARARGTSAALAEYRALAQRPNEAELEQEAYGLLRSKKGTLARALLELVVAAFPDSANAHDCLAWACEALGDEDAAIRSAEATLARLAGETDSARKESLHDAATSRLARLGRGDASALRFGCPPCGGPCDSLRYVAAGPCPACRMMMTEVGRN